MTPLFSFSLTACLPALRNSTDHNFVGCSIDRPCCALHVAVLSCQANVNCQTEELVCHDFLHFCALSVQTEASRCCIRPQDITLWLCSADGVPHLAVHCCLTWSMLSKFYKHHPEQILCCRQSQSSLPSVMSQFCEHHLKPELCCRQVQRLLWSTLPWIIL